MVVHHFRMTDPLASGEPPQKQARVMELPPPPSATSERPQTPAVVIPTIPYLTGPTRTLLARLDSDFFVREITLDPGVQVLVPTAMYNVMNQLNVVNMDIMLQQFTRMWRTLLLKRSDIFKKTSNRRANNYIRIGVNTMTPAPLGDLLYHLGSFYSNIDGIRYLVGPPNRPNDPPDWWTLDVNTQNAWDRTMARMSHRFLMREFRRHMILKDARYIFVCVNLSMTIYSSMSENVTQVYCRVMV